MHAVAFAPSDAIRGGFVESTTRENFRIAHDISSYSLTAIAKAAVPMMQGRAGALLTLSYLGAVRSLPSYNVMGLAKASLEASVRFLAADLGPKGIRVNGYFRRTDQDAGSRGHRRLPQDSRARRRDRAAASQRDASRTSAIPRRSCAPISQPASPARSSTSTAASTPWEWPFGESGIDSAGRDEVVVAVSGCACPVPEFDADERRGRSTSTPRSIPVRYSNTFAVLRRCRRCARPPRRSASEFFVAQPSLGAWRRRQWLRPAARCRHRRRAACVTAITA